MLHLDGNNIGDEDAKALTNALKVNSALSELYLSGNSIGDEGAKAFANAIKDNKTLTYLHLGANKIGDEGAKAFANARRGRRTSTFLHLRNNFADWSVRLIANALKYNITSLSYHCLITSSRMSCIDKLKICWLEIGMN